jgi:heterodisulfide reductase subunit A-like polyferredoxin
VNYFSSLIYSNILGIKNVLQEKDVLIVGGGISGITVALKGFKTMGFIKKSHSCRGQPFKF